MGQAAIHDLPPALPTNLREVYVIMRPQFIFLGLSALLVAVAGCSSSKLSGKDAVAVCDIESLGQQRSAYRNAIMQYSASSVPSNKLRSFEAEVDAQFRAVTSSCKAYMACMAANSYQEALCNNSRLRWETSEAKFKDLAVDLRKICPNCRPGGTAQPRRPRGNQQTACAPGNRGGSTTIASAYTASTPPCGEDS